MGSSSEPRTIGSQPEELRLLARASDLGVAREFVERAASRFGLDAEDAFDLVLATNEAVTNAIRHGSADEHGRILLFVVAVGDRLTLVVRDYGNFTPSRSDSRLDGGRGLGMMRALTDRLDLQADPLGTTVRLSKDRQ